MATSMAQRQLKRYELLTTLYEMVGGRPNYSVSREVLVRESGRDPEQVAQDVAYWAAEGLMHSTFGRPSLTHEGVITAERVMTAMA